nr:retrovirus-related Pol polyprotein from transposon TNT 1-94 [Tanacetum cinerariifolium]
MTNMLCGESLTRVQKRQSFYGYASNMKSKHDVFSTKRIITVTHVKVVKKYDYGYLEEIIIRREDQKLHNFIEGDFPILNLHDIEDIHVVILKRVEDLQLGVKSYQKKLNITRPETFRNGLMRLDELYKFCDGTLSSVRRVLYDIASSLKIDYLPKKDEEDSNLPVHSYRVVCFETLRSNLSLSSLFLDYFIVLCVFKDYLDSTAYNGGNVIFGSNLRGNIIGKDLFGPYAVRIYGGNHYTLVIVDFYSRVLGSKCFILNTKDYLTKFDPKSYEGVILGYSQNSKAYIILNNHTRKIKKSLNVTFDETSPPSKISPLVDDDLDEEEAIKVTEKKNIENDTEDEALEIEEIINIKESRNHLLENVIRNLNQRILRSQA